MESEAMHPRVVLYDYAMSLTKTPYRWGGDDPVDGFDCSGLVIELLQSVGVLPRGFDSTADGLWRFGFAKTQAPTFGSLAFYGKPSVTHVAFCLNDRLMLEAGGGGSSTTSAAAAAAQNAFIRVRPIRWRDDLVGFSHPVYPWKE